MILEYMYVLANKIKIKVRVVMKDVEGLPRNGNASKHKLNSSLPLPLLFYPYSIVALLSSSGRHHSSFLVYSLVVCLPYLPELASLSLRLLYTYSFDSKKAFVKDFK